MTPNTQITKDNVGLLKAGDVCRVNAKPTSWHMSEVGDIVTVLKGPDSRGDYMITPNSQWYSPDRLTYIGPDLGDGWIGHSGGENPVPGMTVQWKARDGVSGKSYCAWGWEWSATDPDRDIIAFRPALSPPAEGSWEYATTKGPRKAWDDANTPPEGEGWERDTSQGRDGWERFDFHEESYWKRPATPTPSPMIAKPGTPPMTPELSAAMEECMAATYPGDDGSALSPPASVIRDSRTTEIAPPAEGEVDWSSGSVYDQLLTLIHDRDYALRGDDRTDPTEIDETVLEIMRITTPTPSPVEKLADFMVPPDQAPAPTDHIGDAAEKVDWTVVGPKLVEALEAIKAGGSWQGDTASDALAPTQPQSNGD